MMKMMAYVWFSVCNIVDRVRKNLLRDVSKESYEVLDGNCGLKVERRRWISSGL